MPSLFLKWRPPPHVRRFPYAVDDSLPATLEDSDLVLSMTLASISQPSYGDYSRVRPALVMPGASST